MSSRSLTMHEVARDNRLWVVLGNERSGKVLGTIGGHNHAIKVGFARYVQCRWFWDVQCTGQLSGKLSSRYSATSIPSKSALLAAGASRLVLSSRVVWIPGMNCGRYCKMGVVVDGWNRNRWIIMKGKRGLEHMGLKPIVESPMDGKGSGKGGLRGGPWGLVGEMTAVVATVLMTVQDGEHKLPSEEEVVTVVRGRRL
ncbi:unnamed protein product [Sphenostylis stenocarpa]|uniref:Uncharacterized protein n=1 Tax=Sphenostylis stenocarpa TaxID=92480 RepID=A0AA86T510_9FABA|nr:unnamed protein product [Sphenostylis stenocarpa]